MFALLAIAAILYLTAHAQHPWRPQSAQDLGWFGLGADQTRYFRAALAWAHGDFDPAQHWYPPGYPLLGALFVPLTPLQPFLLPDLFALLLSLWLFSRLAAIVAPELPYAGLAGAAVFVACVVLVPLSLEVWVEPISSTASTPIVYAGLLAALRFVAAPRRARYAFLTSLAVFSLPAFRTADMLPLIVAMVPAMGIALLRARPGWPAAGRALLAASAGAAIPLSLLLAVHLSIYGFTLGSYLSVASALGFEWRLIPLRWVIIVLDPRPLLADGQGLMQAFPWLMPGLAGAAALVAQPGPRSRPLVDALLVSAVVLHILLYCAFRDLHPFNLFRFSNYHYFKWVFPVLGLYSLRLAWALLAGPRRSAHAAIAAATVLALVPWRVELRASSDQGKAAVADTETTLRFTADLSDVRNSWLVPSSDPSGGNVWKDKLSIGGTEWGRPDFRFYPQPGGLMIAPLRPLGAGAAVLTVTPPVLLRPGVPAVPARQQIVFGLPCWFKPARPACQAAELIPPVDFPLGHPLAFDGTDAPYLAAGWSFVQAGARWTDGKLSGIRMRLDGPLRDQPLVLTLKASALYFPSGAGPLQVGVQVNGRQVAEWSYRDSSEVAFTALIPRDLLGGSNQLAIGLRIDHPRIPRHFQPDSKDSRQLGLYVRSLQIGYDAP